jgi:hypothetical protein
MFRVVAGCIFPEMVLTEPRYIWRYSSTETSAQNTHSLEVGGTESTVTYLALLMPTIPKSYSVFTSRIQARKLSILRWINFQYAILPILLINSLPAVKYNLARSFRRVQVHPPCQQRQALQNLHHRFLHLQLAKAHHLRHQ